MTDIIGDPKDQDSYYYLERILDKITKIQIHDFSLTAARPNLINIKILRLIKGKWFEIGKTTLNVKHTTVEWEDFNIGSDSEFIFIGLGIEIPDYRYEYRKFRNLGIGSKVVNFMIKYLKQYGIKEIYGELSDIDDVEKASNFWKKNGFKVTKYIEQRGHMVAKIQRKL